MKQDSFSKYLKGLVVAVASVGLLVLAVLVPKLGMNISLHNPHLAYLYYPCLIFVYATAVPVYIALWNAWRIFCNIGSDNSFCFDNSLRLRNISYLAVGDTFVYVIAAFVLLFIDALEIGALISIGFIVFAGLTVAILSSSLSHLVDKAASLKEENDLTI